MVVAVYRRIVELVRVLKQVFSRDVCLLFWNAVVRMAHRVRPDLQDDLFPNTWDAELEPTANSHSISHFEAFTNLLADALDEYTKNRTFGQSSLLETLVLRTAHWWVEAIMQVG